MSKEKMGFVNELSTLVEKPVTQRKKGSEMKHQYKCLPCHFIVKIKTNPKTLFL